MKSKTLPTALCRRWFFLVECSVEAVPALWQTRGREGFVLLAEEDASIHPGDVVAEVRAGLVETAACECGAIETVFRTEPQADLCESRGISKLAKRKESCFACGSSERVAARSFQGCSSSPVAVLWMGAKGGKDRSYLAPRGSGSPFELHRRKCVARDSRSRTLQLSPSCPTSPPVTSGGKRPEGLRLKNWRAWILRRSISRLACSRS